MKTGGGWHSIRYVLGSAQKIGVRKLITAVRSKNTCKTCAFGTGGQRGGIHNESRGPIEICNKNIQSHLTDIQPAITDSFFHQTSIAQLRNYKLGELERLGRLVKPLYKKPGDTHYQTMEYQDAIDKIVSRLKQTTPDRSFFYTSGRSSNEAAFILQLFARLYGTNNVNNCSYYCHQASGVGLDSTIGTGTATIQFHDLEQADLIFVIGANPASNHPRFVKTLMHCRRRGGHVVVVNPIKEPGLVRFAVPSDLRSMLKGGDDIASHYIQPHIGGDIAFFKAVAKSLIETETIDKKFIESYTGGYAEYQADITNTSWQDLIAQSGVEQQDIVTIAQLYSTAKNTVFAWGMGMTHHLHGVGNIESIANLALLRGMVGRPGAGLLPLRGHSNVQGVGSMGVTPQLKRTVYDNIQKKLGIQLPTQAGMDTMACMQAADEGGIDAAFILGGNLYAANPDARFAERALNNIPFKVFLHSTLNQGHVHGVEQEVVVLPVAVRDEEKQSTTQESMFNYVRMSNGNIVRFDELPSETDVICDVAEAVIDNKRFNFAPFRYHESIRKAVAAIIPGFGKMQDIDTSKQEFQIEGRTFYQPQFATPDNRAHFRVVPLPQLKRESSHYQMMSLRSEGQFNTIVYEHEDVYRDQTERWVVLMNPQDMQREGLRENDLVGLTNTTGEMHNLKVKPFTIRPGNVATYYPEANVMVPTSVDPRSKTPGFKSVTVTLEKYI